MAEKRAATSSQATEPKRHADDPPAMTYQESDLTSQRLDWYVKFSDEDWDLIKELVKHDESEIANIFDQVVKEKRDKVLCTKLNSYIAAKKKEERFKTAVPVPQKSERNELLLKPGSNLSADWKDMPLIVNGFGVPDILFADCEMFNDLNVGSSHVIVVMFSAVKIPKNRGTPVPIFHTLVNHGKSGKSKGQVKPDWYSVQKIHGITEKQWQWHMDDKLFVSLLEALTERSKLVFWSAELDIKGLVNTYDRCGKDGSEIRRRIVDLQKPAQAILYPVLNSIDGGKHNTKQLMSLPNALRALIEMGKRKRWSPHAINEMQKLAHDQEATKNENRKNSLLDAISVATIYNHLSHDEEHSKKMTGLVKGFL